MNERTICRIDDEQLIEALDKAKRRMVFAAPGVSLRVATKLAAQWRRLGHEAVSVILDVDPAVCRLGYGTLEGLQHLQNTANELGGLLCHQPGLRIGIVVCDDGGLFWTPTPLLIESGAEQPARCNGVILSSLPKKLADELGIGPGAQAEQQIGLDKVPDKKVEALAADLKANPPLPFDISRPVLVFNSQVEFVEFNLEKIQLQRQEIAIPQQVMGLAASNIHSLFRLDVGEELLAEKEKLEHKKREIDKQFTRPMRGFGGSIIRRSQKDEFRTAVKELESALESFRAMVRQQFRAVAESNKKKLMDLLMKALKANPPEECRRFLGRPDEEESLRKWLGGQLYDAFDKAAKVADDMRVTVRFKGVTYECLTAPDFIKLAKEAFPNLQLHEEYSAAREKSDLLA
ncbi:MAG: hypothetical protein EXS24_07435 [Pedosphaera sp.]|nr:hypothetical protein [Pedosphaera sp.]